MTKCILRIFIRVYTLCTCTVSCSSLIMCCMLTKVGIAPGFCWRSALTTWNTSIEPSVLQHSMHAASAQNMADLTNVSLWKGQISNIHSFLFLKNDSHTQSYIYIPAVNDDWSWVVSLLQQDRWCNGSYNGSWVCCCTICIPAKHLELWHSMRLTRLWPYVQVKVVRLGNHIILPTLESVTLNTLSRWPSFILSSIMLTENSPYCCIPDCGQYL